MNAKDKKIIDRKQELFSKNVQDEISDIQNKVKQFYFTKLEKNLKRIFEKSELDRISSEDF